MALEKLICCFNKIFCYHDYSNNCQINKCFPLHLQKQFAYLPIIAFVNVTQIFVKLTFIAMIKNRQQNLLLNQQISVCSGFGAYRK